MVDDGRSSLWRCLFYLLGRVTHINSFSLGVAGDIEDAIAGNFVDGKPNHSLSHYKSQDLQNTRRLFSGQSCFSPLICCVQKFKRGLNRLISLSLSRSPSFSADAHSGRRCTEQPTWAVFFFSVSAETDVVSAETPIRIGYRPRQGAIFPHTEISACIRIGGPKYRYVSADTIRLGRYLNLC